MLSVAACFPEMDLGRFGTYCLVDKHSRAGAGRDSAFWLGAHAPSPIKRIVCCAYNVVNTMSYMCT